MVNPPAHEMLIDGKNCAYRSIYANKDGAVHDVVVMLRFISSWVVRLRPTSVHIFWDADRGDTWRKAIMPTYKDGRKSDEEVKKRLSVAISLMKEIVPNIRSRQYYLDKMEADDLIYAACRVMAPHETTIVSSDGDFLQIPFFMKNVSVYEPKSNKKRDIPERDPSVIKALEGDVADNIDGFDGIGPKKASLMAHNNNLLVEYVKIHGMKDFLDNLKLVDLSLCPYLLMNQMYVRSVLVNNVSQFSMDDIIELASKHNINGLVAEAPKILSVFKNLR